MPVPLTEVLPGIFHWTTIHERWDIEISSYYLVAERVAIDPRVPAEGLDWFRERGVPPGHVLLTNRHHYRHSDEFAGTFGCTVRCHRSGMHEFKSGEQVEPFDFGDELPGGVIACEVDAICPDETALHLPAYDAMAFADGVIRHGGDDLRFVTDDLMDDPPKTKEGLLAAFGKLLDLDFEHALLAHGGPLVGDGKERLRRFVEQAGS